LLKSGLLLCARNDGIFVFQHAVTGKDSPTPTSCLAFIALPTIFPDISVSSSLIPSFQLTNSLQKVNLKNTWV
jgi:hypothetical protein